MSRTLPLAFMLVVPLICGCGPSQDTLYKETVSLLETESSELDRLFEKRNLQLTAIKETKDSIESVKKITDDGVDQLLTLKLNARGDDELRAKIDVSVREARDKRNATIKEREDSIVEIEKKITTIESEIDKQKSVVELLKAKRDQLRTVIAK